jgi:hypothetical protein
MKPLRVRSLLFEGDSVDGARKNEVPALLVDTDKGRIPKGESGITEPRKGEKLNDYNKHQRQKRKRFS